MSPLTRLARGTRILIAHRPILASRPSSSAPYARPAPPPLNPQEQREFEDLVRRAQTPLKDADLREADLTLHPDAPRPLEPEFQGNTNPRTGEIGGPKREPVHRWREDEGDWSYKGKVSDF